MKIRLYIISALVIASNYLSANIEVYDQGSLKEESFKNDRYGAF